MYSFSSTVQLKYYLFIFVFVFVCKWSMLMQGNFQNSVSSTGKEIFFP